MPSTNNKPEILSAGIVTVCIESDIANQLERMIRKRSWIVNFSNFDAYISSIRRPSFSPQMKSSENCIAFVDFDKTPDEATKTAQYLKQIFAGKLTVIAIAKTSKPELLLEAMRAGCNEFLHKPINEIVLNELFDRIEKNWLTFAQKNTKSGSIISFWGAKGGVGTTTLAVHLAIYLVQCHKKRVLLIDQHTELGHICVYLGIDGSNYCFHEVVRNVNRLDSELLHGFIAKHSSGLEILSSPDTCGGEKSIDSDSLTRTLEFLQSEYDYVIIDGPCTFRDTGIAIIEASEYFYLVTTPEVGAIRDLSRYVDKLILFENMLPKLHLVVNRSSSPYTIQVEQIKKAIKLPIAVEIPNCYPELMRSDNLGEPISPKSDSALAKAFTKWADIVAGSRQDNALIKKSKRLFTMWL